jgi:hypothetical protein
MGPGRLDRPLEGCSATRVTVASCVRSLTYCA